MRSGLSLIYARGLLERHAHLKQVVGISREPPGQGGGISEDIVYAEQHEWTDEERAAIKRDCDNASVLQDTKEHRYQSDEFPDVETIVIEKQDMTPPRSHLNRQQRRARKARARNQKSK